MSFDRRSFIVASGVAAAGAMLAPALSVTAAHAAAPKAGAQVPGFYRTKVGDIEITSLLDGGMMLANELLSAKPDEIKAAKDRSFIPQGDEFPAYLNGFLINNGKKLTLVDTGAANGFGPTTGKLFDNLRAAGYAPEQVDDIILTHAHPDHANGLINAAGERMFRNAKIRISEQELAFWFDPAMESKYAKKKELFLAARKNLTPYKDTGQIITFKLGGDIGGGLSSVNLAGHTPGHSGVRVSSGKEQLLIWADIVHFSAIQFENPKVTIGFDTEPEQAMTTRQKIFDETSADRIRVAGMHLCFPGIGHVAKRGNGYEFIAQNFETAL